MTKIAAAILTWYDANRRELPWRAAAGQTPNPYYVWISEIMLQQTTVPAVMKYFTRFIARFPSVHDLAAADLDEVLTLWQGLGYYARARNLHRAAQIIAREYHGRFPNTKSELLALPGIGPYTAGAIAAIAFDRAEYAVDANVERVVARLFAVTESLPKSKKIIFAHAEQLTPQKRPGDYLQSMMDLGATICADRNPQCGQCPLAGHCRALELGIAGDLPRKIKPASKPTRYGWAMAAVNDRGQIYLQRRDGKSMLGGMMELPSSNWDDKSAVKKNSPQLPEHIEWKKLRGGVRHGFTHFDLHLDVYVANTNHRPAAGGFWHDIDDLADVALPTLYKKAIKLALKK